MVKVLLVVPSALYREYMWIVMGDIHETDFVTTPLRLM